MNFLKKQEKEALDNARSLYIEKCPLVKYATGNKKTTGLVIGADYADGYKGRGVYLILRGMKVLHESEVELASAAPEKTKKQILNTNVHYDFEKEVFMQVFQANGKTLTAEILPTQFAEMVEHYEKVWSDYVKFKMGATHEPAQA